MDILSQQSENQHPESAEKRNIEETGYNELIPIADGGFIHKSEFNKDGLYGLIILPIVGILISTLIVLARKYQFQWILRCVDCITRNPRPDEEVVETELGTLPDTTDSSISVMGNDLITQHHFYWDDLFEYDPSIESNSDDMLYVDSAVQTSLAEVTFAQEEEFGFASDDHNVMSSLDEDDIIYLNIKEPNINEDIMRFNSTMNSEQDERSATRSGKVYK